MDEIKALPAFKSSDVRRRDFFITYGACHILMLKRHRDGRANFTRELRALGL
ncbi:hypothetical protein [Polaromonas sp.]|uniref:hypothetical protein n=1 Tax=Polaromonas sp. TaxID=1869339 RepID=UPI003BAC268C